MKKVHFVFEMVLGLLLANCAPPTPKPTLYVAPGVTGFQKYPSYPLEYQDTGRVGQVLTKCAILPDRHVSDCRVLAVEGGDGFARAALAWLQQPNYRAPVLPPRIPDPEAGYRVWEVSFAAPGSPLNQWLPISGSHATLPAKYDGPPHAGVIADCAIDPSGSPHDCQIVYDKMIKALDAPALAWLARDDVRYAPTQYKSAGPRRLVSVPFATAPIQ